METISPKICVRCGKKVEDGKLYCIECRKKRNREEFERRHWYKSHGICPRCGKNDLMGDENVCIECGQKNYVAEMRRRERIGKEQYNQYAREYHKRHYHELIEKGLCPRCGKRKPGNGYRTCAICRQKDLNTRRRRYKKPKQEGWIKDGLCYFCGAPVKDGYKVCEKHYKMCVDKLDSEKCRENRKRYK